MLNISTQRVNEQVRPERFESISNAEARTSGRVFLRLMIITFGLLILAMFLPWTQNVRAYGTVTAFDPSQRPQTVQSVIGGRIEQWYIREGDFVERGDTILRLSETKSEYLDPDLIARTEQQRDAKSLSEQSYQAKAEALDVRIGALTNTATLKLQQAENKLRQARFKIASDSIEVEAARIVTSTADDQLERMEELYRDGLKSLTDLEARRVKQREASAKLISAENKLLTSRNEAINARVEISGIRAKLQEDLAKARSERLSSLSDVYTARAEVSKLDNQVSNYTLRNGMYFVTAPQDGYIARALQVGLGETIKEGEQIVSIMPSDYELAVEVFVDPLDLPLLERGEEVNIQFEGWPSIVFSGWPNTSYGTFEGKIAAIDNFATDGGKYRLLVNQDEQEWPEALRPGAGANALILLDDVPVWYEIWRQLNGFPPNITEAAQANTGQKKKGK